jgi:type II secretory pathway component PulF
LDGVLRQDLSKALSRWRRAPHERAAARGKKWAGPRYVRKKRWWRDLLFLTSQLHAIVRVNAPLEEGLRTALPTTPSAKLEHVVLALRADVVAGLSLSEAMRGLPRFFPAYYADLIRAGEETGTLDACIQTILRQQHQRNSDWKTVRGWFLYLGFMLCVMCSQFVFIMTVILPEFLETLGDFGVKPVWPVVSVVAFGGALARWKWELAVLVLVAFFPRSWLPGVRRISRRRFWRRLAIHLPVLGAAQEWDSLSHAASVLERLLHAGVPIDRALEDVAALDIQPHYRGIFLRIRDRVQKGVSLSEAAKAESALPASFKTMLAVGDASGMMPQALERLAALYERQARTRTRILIETLSPLVVLIIGSGVLLIMVSVFASMTAIADVLAASV